MIGGEPGTGTGTLLQRVFGKKASKLSISLTLGSTEAVKSAVREGLGISIVFSSAVSSEVRARELRALPIAGLQVTKDLYVILPEDTPPASPAKNFAEMLMSV